MRWRKIGGRLRRRERITSFDVSIVNRYRRQRKLSFKAAVNAALREGLAQMDTPSRPPKPFVTETVDLGDYRIPLDDVAEALAEGDAWR